MRFVTLCGLAAILTTAALAQQPTVTGLQNNYSYLQPGLPNYGIAQGAVFDIFGTNLATGAATPLLSVPLQTTVNGVSATVTVNGTSVPLLLYFVSPTQIAAILPSRTPAGTGQITVTRSGQSSAPVPIQVVPSAFGILTLNGAGSGAAAAFDVNSNYLGFTNAVNPGEFITLWGSGVGPAPGDEANLQVPQDLSSLPISVEVGGISATVAYHGRSIYPGLDQINVIVPQGVQGCFVSVVVRTGNVVSNFATIPVASTGRTCSDQTTGFTTAVLQTLSSKAAFTEGSVFIAKGATTSPAGVVSTSEFASALFTRIKSNQFSANLFAGLGASLGSCTVYQTNSQGGILANDPNTATNLNAGAGINLKGPNGSQTLARQSFGSYFGSISGGTTGIPVFIPSTGGTFSFDNGSGGPDVGPFTGQVTITSPFVWSNQSSITTVNRSQELTVTWTSGDPNSYVSIIGMSLSGGTSPVGALFNCSAPVAAGRFTVPQSVLLSLPVSATPGDANSYLSVSNVSYPQPFTAPGLDIGFAEISRAATQDLRFQ